MTPAEAAAGQAYGDVAINAYNNPPQFQVIGEYAGPGAGGAGYAPAGTTVTLSNGITVTRNANNQITATWQDGYSTGIKQPGYSYGVVFDNSGVYNADPITGEKITIDPATGQPTVVTPSSGLTATATPWSSYHVDGGAITPVATIELDNPADVPLTTQDVPTVAINGGGGESFWTSANNYAAQNDPGVMALNWAADHIQGPLSGALRMTAAVDEGIHRGAGNFVINTVGGLVNAVTHPVQTVVGAVKAGIGALDYIGEAELGEVNPLSDAYNLATSSYNNAVNGFNQEVQTQGSYAAIRDASAGGTEVVLNVGSALVPGLDAVDAARGVEVASDIGRAGDITDMVGVADRTGCFIAGTLVHTRNGLRPIEEIRIGDYVLSQPEMTGERSYRPVIETFVYDDKSILEITYADASGRMESVYSTYLHPFWVKGVGWQGAEFLKVGQVLELQDGRDADITGVTETGRNERVYNFTVDGLHTYYVGEMGVWVHNVGVCEQGLQLDWSRQRWDGQTTEEHVRLHESDNLAKPLHGIFNDDAVATTEDAWDYAKSVGLKPVVSTPFKEEYLVPMPNAGTEGGFLGSGKALHNVRIVVTKSGQLITAFPQ